MRHPDEGVLRRLLDEPAGVADPDRRHVAACTACLTTLAAVRDDAALVAGSLRAGPAPDADAAWQRLTAATPAAPVPLRRPGRPRALLRRPAAAALATVVVLAGASAAAANDWLQVFRAEEVAAVRLDPADLVGLPDLRAYGDLAVTSDPQVHEVDDVAAAEAESGLDVPEVDDLPRGVVGAPSVSVGGKAAATFTYSAAKAARTSGAEVPPGLDGARVRLEAGPGVAQVWESSSGVPALVVARAVAPTAATSGVPWSAVRDHLLSLPGLPAGVAAQLRTFAEDGSTLPLPVPSDEVTSRSTTVGGVPATLLALEDRTLAGVVWVEDGTLTVVAGSLDDDEVLAVARDLR